MFTGLCSSNPSPKLIHNIHIPTVIPDFLWYRTSPVRYNIRIGAIQHHYRSLNQNSYALSLSKALVNKVSTVCICWGGGLVPIPLPNRWKGAINGHSNLRTSLNEQNLPLDAAKFEIWPALLGPTGKILLGQCDSWQQLSENYVATFRIF